MQAGFNRRDIGKYVSEDIGVRLIVDHRAFKLRKRIATVMFTGIEGFTLLAEDINSAGLLLMLDDYFEGLGTRFSADGGVLGQFQGDVLIATSNVPVSNENYVSSALRAGLSIEEIMDRETSRDKKL
jgi:adenylate cyclase